MEKEFLELPSDLIERRQVLEKALASVVTEVCFTGLREELIKLFEEYKVEPKPDHVEWSFSGEYDDEGGTTYYPTGVQINANGDEIECKELTINKKSKWSDTYYDNELGEEILEIICDYREDLYEHGIEEITL
jgi:hypothetical protein